MIIDNIIHRNSKSQALHLAFIVHYRENHFTFSTFGFITEYYFTEGKEKPSFYCDNYTNNQHYCNLKLVNSKFQFYLLFQK